MSTDFGQFLMFLSRFAHFGEVPSSWCWPLSALAFHFAAFQARPLASFSFGLPSFLLLFHWMSSGSRIVRLKAFHSSFKLAAWVKLVLFIGFSKDPQTLIRRKAEPDISQCKVANSSKCLGGP